MCDASLDATRLGEKSSIRLHDDVIVADKSMCGEQQKQQKQHTNPTPNGHVQRSMAAEDTRAIR
jgi:hypothetical protein